MCTHAHDDEKKTMKKWKLLYVLGDEKIKKNILFFLYTNRLHSVYLRVNACCFPRYIKWIW
jgi:hypothetical protein